MIYYLWHDVMTPFRCAPFDSFIQIDAYNFSHMNSLGAYTLNFRNDFYHVRNTEEKDKLCCRIHYLRCSSTYASFFHSPA